MTVAITIAGESRTFSTTFGKEFRGEIHLADLIDHHDPATEDCIFHCRQRKLLKGRHIDPILCRLGPDCQAQRARELQISLQRGHAKALAYPVFTNLDGGESSGNLPKLPGEGLNQRSPSNAWSSGHQHVLHGVSSGVSMLTLVLRQQLWSRNRAQDQAYFMGIRGITIAPWLCLPLELSSLEWLSSII